MGYGLKVLNMVLELCTEHLPCKAATGLPVIAIEYKVELVLPVLDEVHAVRHEQIWSGNAKFSELSSPKI